MYLVLPPHPLPVPVSAETMAIMDEVMKRCPAVQMNRTAIDRLVEELAAERPSDPVQFALTLLNNPMKQAPQKTSFRPQSATRRPPSASSRPSTAKQSAGAAVATDDASVAKVRATAARPLTLPSECPRLSGCCAPRRCKR